MSKKDLQKDITYVFVDINKAELYLNIAREKYQSNCFDEAKNYLRKAIELKQYDYRLHYMLGLCYSNLQSYKEALWSFGRAIVLNPSFAEVYFHRAIVLLRLNYLPSALRSLNVAINTKPDYVDAHVNRGLVLIMCGRFTEALASFHNAIKLDPNSFEAYYGCGVVLSMLQDFYGALKNFNKAIQLKPDYTEAYDRRMFVLDKLLQPAFSERAFVLNELIQPTLTRDDSIPNQEMMRTRGLQATESKDNVSSHDGSTGEDERRVQVLTGRYRTGDVVARVGLITKAAKREREEKEEKEEKDTDMEQGSKRHKSSHNQ